MSTNAFGQDIGAPLPDWTARSLPPRTPIEGRHVIIEPLDAARHAPDLFAAFAEAPDARDWTYLPVDRLDSETTYRAFACTLAESQDPLHYVVASQGEGRALGTAALMRMDPANGVIEIGHIVFSPRLQRSTGATEAIFLLARRVFDELGYRRFEWKCDSLNAPSRRAAERYGFVFEGIFRQAVVTKGRNRDTAWYAMTDQDWPAARRAFLSWLDPSNFDAAGRQIDRLESFR